MKLLWLTLGLLSFALGLIGVPLPLLPTVPFMLLAAFCFARSSERLHSWLLSHSYFGPAILDWQRNGAINRRVKWISTASLVLVLTMSIVFQIKPAVIIIQIITLTCVAIFIWTRPEA